MDTESLTPAQVGRRALELVEMIQEMPDEVYARWIGGRAIDLTALSVTIMAAMEEDSPQFDKEKLRMQAASIPLAIAYMLGRQDAAKRFSRVLRPLLKNPELARVVGTALRIYGWPESKPRPPQPIRDVLKNILDDLAASAQKGDDDNDLHFDLHDLR